MPRWLSIISYPKHACLTSCSCELIFTRSLLSFQMENVRFTQLALHQGKGKKAKAAVTMVSILQWTLSPKRFFRERVYKSGFQFNVESN